VSLVYWDTMLFIYWLESNPQYGKQVERIHKRMLQRGDQICTSVFAVGEVLTGAYKTGRTKEALTLRKYLEGGGIRLLAFGVETADRYARIRAQYNVSPADAIHLATASVAQVDLYITNDAGVKKLLVDGIKFIAGLDGTIF